MVDEKHKTWRVVVTCVAFLLRYIPWGTVRATRNHSLLFQHELSQAKRSLWILRHPDRLWQRRRPCARLEALGHGPVQSVSLPHIPARNADMFPSGVEHRGLVAMLDGPGA